MKALDAPADSAVRILISGDYTRIGSLIRLIDGLSPAAARRVIAALNGAPNERRAHYQPVLDPSAAAAPSRAGPAAATTTEDASAAAARRQRAFAVALAQLRVQKSG